MFLESIQLTYSKFLSMYKCISEDRAVEETYGEMTIRLSELRKYILIKKTRNLSV